MGHHMIRSFIYLQILLLSILYSCQANEISKEDLVILDHFRQYACEHHLNSLPVNERIPMIARFFLNTPYQSNTLNVTQEELPIINLREFDCVTFVENVLALAFVEEYNHQLVEKFMDNILHIRYRNGEIEDYTSRLHYSSDWLYEMQQQDLLTDLTQLAGGIPFSPDVFYMSRNSKLYPPLQDQKLLEKIKNIETAINQRTYYYIPKDKVNEADDKIKNGDIILITTNIKGLDTSHVGFAYKKEGKTCLLHASSKGKKVMISKQPLQEYMEGIPSQSGIMIGRTISKALSEKDNIKQ